MTSPLPVRGAAVAARLLGLWFVFLAAPLARAADEAPASPAVEKTDEESVKADTPKKDKKKDKKEEAPAAGEAAASPGEASSEDATDSAEGVTPAKDEKAKFGTVAALEGGSGVRVATICTNCNQANLTMNGVTGSDHVLVTFKGVPAVGGLGTVYALQQFPGDMIGYTHVTRGPGSALSGSGAMGGTIEFHPVTPTTEEKSFLRAEAGNWATHSLKLAGADRWGPVGALVALQATEANNVDANHDGANEVGSFDRYTYHGIFDFHLTERQTLGVNYLFYGEDQVAGPGRPQSLTNDFADEDVSFNWHQYGATWEWLGDDGSEVHFDFSSSRRHQQQISPVNPGQPPLSYLIVTDLREHARIEGKLPMGKAGMLTAGAGYERTNIEWFNEEALRERYVDDGLEHIEAYAQYDQSLGSHWQIGGGLRFDQLTTFGRARTWDYDPWTVAPEKPSNYGLPRFQARWRPNDKVMVGVATGKFAVGPIPAAEKTCCGAQIERTVDMDKERSWSNQIEVELHPTKDMRITSAFYRTDFRDYILRVVRNSTLGVPRYGLDNVPEARVQGVDIVHDMRFKGNMFNVGWTYNYSSPEDGDGHDLPYLARNAASGYVRFDHVPKGTKLSLDVIWTGPIRHYQLSTQPMANRPPVGYLESEAFTTANLGFEQRIGKKGWYLQAGVNNVTDYVMSDLDRVDKNGNGTDDIYERCFDWGPITGRYGWVAFKWSR